MTRFSAVPARRLSFQLSWEEYHRLKNDFSEPVDLIVSIMFMPFSTEERSAFELVAAEREMIALRSCSFKSRKVFSSSIEMQIIVIVWL